MQLLSKIALRYAIRFPWATKPKDSSPNGLVQLRLCCGVDIKLWELHGNPNQNNPSNFTLSKFRIAVRNPVASSMSNNTGSLSWSKPCLSTCNFKRTNYIYINNFATYTWNDGWSKGNFLLQKDMKPSIFCLPPIFKGTNLLLVWWRGISTNWPFAAVATTTTTTTTTTATTALIIHRPWQIKIRCTSTSTLDSQTGSVWCGDHFWSTRSSILRWMTSKSYEQKHTSEWTLCQCFRLTISWLIYCSTIHVWPQENQQLPGWRKNKHMLLQMFSVWFL